tara:strand:- start:730 stop:1641 length:912 start_codon:yes stop_codon:yes gene_type:complete
MEIEYTDLKKKRNGSLRGGYDSDSDYDSEYENRHSYSPKYQVLILFRRGLESENRNTLNTIWNNNEDIHEYIRINNRDAILHAVRRKNEKVVKFLSDKGFDINYMELGQMLRWCPLFIAVWDRNYNMVKLLLNNGANINISDEKGETAVGMSIDATQKGKNIFDLLMEYNPIITNKQIEDVNYLINQSNNNENRQEKYRYFLRKLENKKETDKRKKNIYDEIKPDVGNKIPSLRDISIAKLRDPDKLDIARNLLLPLDTEKPIKPSSFKSKNKKGGKSLKKKRNKRRKTLKKKRKTKRKYSKG